MRDAFVILLAAALSGSCGCSHVGRQGGSPSPVLGAVPRPGASSAVTVTPIKAAYDKAAEDYLIRGLSVAIVENGRTTFQSLGDADSEFALFEIGSVSKAFAGVAAAKLSLTGKIALDAPISTYLPELQGTYSGTITPRQLGTHTALLPREIMTSSGSISDYPESEVISFLKKYDPDRDLFPSGTREYSNLGFVTLGLVLSRAENKSYQAVIRDEVLIPLKMSRTGFITSVTRPQGLLIGYDVLLREGRYGRFSDLRCATGGVFSNAHEMALFLNANIQPDSSLIGRALKLSQDAGLGWDSKPGTLPIEKNGAMEDGFASKIKFTPGDPAAPGTGKGLVVLNNVKNSSLTDSIAEQGLGGLDSNFFKVISYDAAYISSVGGTYLSEESEFKITIFPFQEKFIASRIEHSTSDLAINARLFVMKISPAVPERLVLLDGTAPYLVEFKPEKNLLIWTGPTGFDKEGNLLYKPNVIFRKQ
jgi:CubicO group peptidase (beta-lactamase class C family)